MYSQAFLDWLKKTESFVPNAYLDQGGRWAYGYGYSNLFPDTVVKEGDTISEPDAEKLLIRCLDYIWDKVRPHITPELSPDQKGVISSLSYNGGIKGFLDSNVLAMINNVDKRYNLLYAADLILDYKITAKDKFTGVPRRLIGLRSRRIDEAYFFKKDLTW